MARVKRGVTSHRRHKKILSRAKGYYAARSKTYKAAKQAVTRAGQYAYRDRKTRKRSFRALWIVRINAAARLLDLSYSQFIRGLHLANIEIDRKCLAELALNEPQVFEAILVQAKEALVRGKD